MSLVVKKYFFALSWVKTLLLNNVVMIQFLMFAGVGVIGTAGQYLILFGLVNFLKINPVCASNVGFLAGAFINYLLNYKITFKSSKNHRKSAVKFAIIALIGLFLNSTLMGLMINFFNLYYMVAQLLATGVVLLWNFTGNKLWVFKV